MPPINVLIVEDNIINQKLLEAFMKRLKVRWKCAGNGEEALKKWRQGGFHLVLMDIQLPVMNGLEATKEIRRLERLNGIGVFPKTPDGRSSVTNANAAVVPGGSHEPGPSSEEDTLHDRSLFKSPVIIVALTASSLQSDRHEALAAGCNDFLTKVAPSPLPLSPSHLIHSWTNMYSPSDSPGSNKKSQNGAACKPSSTSKAGANGAASTITPSPRPYQQTATPVPCTRAVINKSRNRRPRFPRLYPRAAR